VTVVVFDLDGTLIDSAPDIHAAACRMLEAVGRPPVTLAQARGFVGRGAATFVARALAATGGADAATQARALEAFHAAYHAQGATLTVVFPGAREALAALRDGGARVGLCTNKPEAVTLTALDELGLSPLFDAVVGAGALPLKPAPDMLLACFDRLGGRGLFVGDSETDAATAEAAGAPFALYEHGYRHGPIEAAFTFGDFAALPAYALGRVHG
jgi:phosphoglycolate phosphatase